jgi:hypothetical protein
MLLKLASAWREDAEELRRGEEFLRRRPELKGKSGHGGSLGEGSMVARILRVMGLGAGCG